MHLHKYLALVRYSIDAQNGTLYFAYKANNVNPDDRTNVIIRCTPWTVSVNHNSPKAEDKFYCWPNPASDVVHVQGSKEFDHSSSIQIMDYFGRVTAAVSQSTLELGTKTVDIDVRDLVSGSYFLIITQRELVKTVPIVILH